MIFVCSQFLERGREKKLPIIIDFVNLNSTIATVERVILFEVTEKFRTPHSFTLLKRFTPTILLHFVSDMSSWRPLR